MFQSRTTSQRIPRPQDVISALSHSQPLIQGLSLLAFLSMGIPDLRRATRLLPFLMSHRRGNVERQQSALSAPRRTHGIFQDARSTQASRFDRI